MVLFALLAACAAHRPPPAAAAPPHLVVLVSLDGFRAEYLDRLQPPNLLGLAADGARAEALIPSFPSKTLPNHVTLVTGLYPGHHGIVSNRFYDPDLDDTFDFRDLDDLADGRFYSAEPVWVTAERQGVRTATAFWPGSEVKIGGLRPSDWLPYDPSLSGDARLDQVFSWLDRPPERRPGFVTLYLSPVDTMGHRYGPESAQVGKAVAYVDGLVGELVAGLQARGLWEATDLVVVSDHGMAAISADRFTSLQGVLEPGMAELVDASPVIGVWPAEGQEDAVLAGLGGVEHATVTTRDALPARYHYEGSPRVPPVLLVADPGWTVGWPKLQKNLEDADLGGAHGYDNQDPDMAAILVAHGPGFGRGVTAPPFENVHVYPLLCDLLAVDCPASDGRLDATAPLRAR